MGGYRPGASLTKQTGRISDTGIDMGRREEEWHALEEKAVEKMNTQ